MTLQARVIGPEEDLGPITTINFFGNDIGREFSDVELTKEQVVKAHGNRFIELKGTKPDQNAEQADEEGDAIRARLAELGVSVDGRASLKTLRSKVDAAEQAEAKRPEAASAE